jgi:NAD-dependent DNA ligase
VALLIRLNTQGTTMSNDFARQAIFYKNELKQSLGVLIGIATGLLADRTLSDSEIQYLHDWVTAHDEVAFAWPGDIIHQRVKAVLAAGIITEAKRAYLVDTLRQLVGDSPETVTQAAHVTELAFDEEGPVVFEGCTFCLTGNFVYAPGDVCEVEVTKRGGIVKSGVSKRVRYVVVGSLGSPEWKHGSFGTKIEKAIELKRQGAPIAVVKEDRWVVALSGLQPPNGPVVSENPTGN